MIVELEEDMERFGNLEYLAPQPLDSEFLSKLVKISPQLKIKLTGAL